MQKNLYLIQFENHDWLEQSLKNVNIKTDFVMEKFLNFPLLNNRLFVLGEAIKFKALS